MKFTQHSLHIIKSIISLTDGFIILIVYEDFACGVHCAQFCIHAYHTEHYFVHFKDLFNRIGLKFR